MIRSNEIRNESGFSLLEVIIASGLVVVAALALSALMVDQAKQTKNAETRNSYTSVVDSTQSSSTDVQSVLSSEVQLED